MSTVPRHKVRGTFLARPMSRLTIRAPKRHVSAPATRYVHPEPRTFSCCLAPGESHFDHIFAMIHTLLPRSVLRRARTQTRRISPTLFAQQSAFRRLLSSLAVLEQRDGKLNISSLAAVTAAEKLGGSITGFIAGSGTKAIAEEAAKVKGLEKVIYVENDAYSRV